MSELSDVISVACSAVAIPISVYAAYLSRRSAKAAETSADAARSANERGVRRSLLDKCSEVVGEKARILKLAVDATTKNDSDAVMTGNFGSSRHKALNDNSAANLELTHQHAHRAETLLSSEQALAELGSNDLDQELTRVSRDLHTLRVIRESLERFLSPRV